jgi:DNA-binding IclR family transcriptional regulator
MGTKTDPRTETVQAVERTFSIIEYLYDEDTSGMRELADHLGVAKSTVYKHLNTLEQNGWVVETDHQYRLSYQFLHVGGHVRDRQRLCKVAQRKLRDFANGRDLMAMFSVLEGDEGVFLYRINDTIGLANGIPIGVRFDLHQNAAGKTMLASLSDDRIQEIVSAKGLTPATDRTLTDEDELWDEIEQVRDQGYALNIEERKAQLNAVACTAADPEQNILGAISLCGPASRLPKEDLHELGDTSRVIAEEIELQIKYG